MSDVSHRELMFHDASFLAYAHERAYTRFHWLSQYDESTVSPPPPPWWIEPEPSDARVFFRPFAPPARPLHRRIGQLFDSSSLFPI
jgi:hypothetical protein